MNWYDLMIAILWTLGGAIFVMIWGHFYLLALHKSWTSDDEQPNKAETIKRGRK